MPLYVNQTGGGIVKTDTNDNIYGNNVVVTNSPLGALNVALGNDALASIFTTAGATAANNIAVGSNAIFYATTGSDNIAVGNDSLPATTGSRNTAVGYQTLGAIEGLSGPVVTGDNNNAFGWRALNKIQDGAANIAIGAGSLRDVVSADNNIAVGFRAGEKHVTGDSNIFIGYQANFDETSAGNECIYIGANTNTDGNGPYTKSIAIGSGAQITSDNEIVLGTSAETVTIPGNLNAPGLGGGVFAAAISSSINAAYASIDGAVYTAVNGIVTYSGSLEVVPNSTGLVGLFITLPLPDNGETDFGGSGAGLESTETVAVSAIVSDNELVLTFAANTTGAYAVGFNVQYAVA